MRRPSPLGLAAIGLALSVSATTRAQSPDSPQPAAAKPVAPKDVAVDPTNPETWNSQNTTAAERRRMRRHQEVTRVPVGILTDAQAAELRKQGAPRGWRNYDVVATHPGAALPTAAEASSMPGGPSAVVASGPPTPGCASCAAAASGTTVTEGTTTYTVINSAPAGSPPGYAIVGAPMPTAEPTPIGVMRTSYGNGQASPMPSMASSPGYASVGGPSPSMGMNSGALPPAQNAIAPQPLGRPHIIAHVLGFSGRGPVRSLLDHRNSRERAQHAAIAYGGESTVSELPGSVVYGR